MVIQFLNRLLNSLRRSHFRRAFYCLFAAVVGFVTFGNLGVLLSPICLWALRESAGAAPSVSAYPRKTWVAWALIGVLPTAIYSINLFLGVQYQKGEVYDPTASAKSTLVGVIKECAVIQARDGRKHVIAGISHRTSSGSPQRFGAYRLTSGLDHGHLDPQASCMKVAAIPVDPGSQLPRFQIVHTDQDVVKTCEVPSGATTQADVYGCIEGKW